jgi:PAS domain S-box-containing protein
MTTIYDGLFQTMLNSLTATIAVLDETGTIIAINKAWEHFAYENGDPDLIHTGIGISYLAVCQAAACTSGEAQQAFEGISAVLAGTLDQFMLEYPCHSPLEERWFELRVTPLDGEHGGVVISHEKITARKRAEQALQQQITSVHLLQTVAVAATEVVTLEDTLQIVVRQICTHIGWPVGHVYLASEAGPYALTSTEIWHLTDPDHFAIFRKVTEELGLALIDDLPGQVLISGKPEWIADMTTLPNGPRTKPIGDIGLRAGFALPVLVGAEVAAVLEFFSGEATAPDVKLLDVMVNVGAQLGRVVERVRAESALRASEERYRLLAENTGDMILLVNDQGRYIYISPSCQKVLGYQPAELVGTIAFDLIHPDDRAAVEAEWEQTLAHDTGRIMMRYRHADDSWRWLEARGTTVFQEGACYVVGMFRDITERKQAEEALRTAEARYRTLVEQMPAIIYTADADAHSTIRYISPQVQAILGFTPEEWLADSELWLRQIHPEDRARVLDNVAHIRASDESVPTEYRVFRSDGQVVWLQDAARLVCDEDGRPLYLQGITMDITERKHAEAALRRSERLYRTLANNFPNGAVFLFDHDLRFTIADGQALTRLGVSREQLEGKRLEEILPPDLFRGTEPLYYAALEGAQSVAETMFGDHTYMAYYLPVRNEQGEIFAGMLMAHDITERKRAEEALQQSEERYRTLFETMVQGVIYQDADGQVISANPAAYHILGLTLDQMQGRTPIDPGWKVVYEDSSDYPGTIYSGKGTLNNHVEARNVILGVCKPNDEQRWILINAVQQFRLDEVQPYQGYTIFEDITERKCAQDALVEERALLARRVEERTTDLSAANAELSRAARLKDEFLASMSHELRTPLNAVLGLAEALQEEIYGPLNEQQCKSLHSIEESGRHLLALINDILDLAKIDAGKLDLERESVAVVEICQTSLGMIKQDAKKKDISIDLAIDPSVTLLHADPRRLKQILVNLLSNAVKFTSAHGAIGLEVIGDTVRQAVDMTVWDTGIGIAQEDLGRLFEPFVQLDSRLARQYNGTGLGLTLVYRMAKMHGGSITVTSTVGAGSRFTVSLPWQILGEKIEPSRPTPATRSLVAIRKALIIEDSPTAVTQLVRYLSELGMVAISHLQNVDAVAKVLELQPDLIVLDVLLPDTPRWEVLRQLKAEPRTRSIPVLIISAAQERLYGLGLGADDYVIKPFSNGDVQQILRRLARVGLPEGAPALDAVATHELPAARPAVLLAEDNEANIMTVSDYLSAKGYEVVIARNGAEAVARACEVEPAIILMDIQMPGMDGLEATRRIRAQSNMLHTPIIALTALAMPGDRERCLAAGADDYLSKPVSLRGLATLIEAKLQHHTVVV